MGYCQQGTNSRYQVVYIIKQNSVHAVPVPWCASPQGVLGLPQRVAAQEEE